ncbi:Mu P family protein [Komagataeibacter europaeus]|uniref:Mu P family protein n=1 Tax=Komagataeibacter europaeus TaxID=33995 RepID=UPI000237EFCB|nr:Mu P family protein [Komagataeibacter europaeus]
MSTIEKLSRQRGVLVTSDGVGGIVLTQAGSTRAPGRLALPGNVYRMESRVSARGRVFGCVGQGDVQKPFTAR